MINKLLSMEVQERVREEIADLRKAIDKQIDKVSRLTANSNFKELLEHKELIEKMGKIEYFESLAKSAYSLALDYANIASKSSYARELTIINLLLSRLYADIVHALLEGANLGSIIPDVIEVSNLFTDFSSMVYVPQKLEEISEKISNLKIDEAVKKELVDDLNKLENAFKVKIHEFDDGLMIFIDSEKVSDIEDHDAIVQVYRDKNKRIAVVDIVYHDKDD